MERSIIKDSSNVSQLMEALPLNLKHQMSVAMYKELYTSIDWLREK